MMNRGMAIREGVDRAMNLNAGPQALGQAPVRKPLDPSLDEVAQQVAQPQLFIVTSQEEVDQVVHKPTETAITEATRFLVPEPRNNSLICPMNGALRRDGMPTACLFDYSDLALKNASSRILLTLESYVVSVDSVARDSDGDQRRDRHQDHGRSIDVVRHRYFSQRRPSAVAIASRISSDSAGSSTARDRMSAPTRPAIVASAFSRRAACDRPGTSFTNASIRARNPSVKARRTARG